MANVLIVAYLLIVLALIAVILLQRSEGGGLGIGGGSNGFMTARGSANVLTRTTAILAALFFATAIGLTILSELDRGSSSILDRAAQQTNANGEMQAPTNVLDALNQLNGNTTTNNTTPAPAVPAPATPAAPAAPADAPDLAVPQTTAPADNAAPAQTTTPAAPSDATTPATPPAGTQQQPAPATGSGATTNQ